MWVVFEIVAKSWFKVQTSETVPKPQFRPTEPQFRTVTILKVKEPQFCPKITRRSIRDVNPPPDREGQFLQPCPKPKRGKYTRSSWKLNPRHIAKRLDHFLIQSSYLLDSLVLHCFILKPQTNFSKHTSKWGLWPNCIQVQFMGYNTNNVLGNLFNKLQISRFNDHLPLFG